MRTFFSLVAVTTALLTSTLAHADGAFAQLSGPMMSQYEVDLTALHGNGTPLYATFFNGRGNVPYAPVTVRSNAAAGQCWRIAAFGIDASDEQIWVQTSPGTWTSIADDTVGRDPHVWIYTTGDSPIEVRVADFNIGIKGHFNMTFDAFTAMSGADPARCDALSNGEPFIKVGPGGAITVVRHQGA